MTQDDQVVRKAVIPAAGLGTRLLPATKSLPKEMLPIVNKPTLQYVVEEAVASDITDILIVTGKGKHAIEDHFDAALELEESLKAQGKLTALHTVRELTSMANIYYVRQPRPLGLGHAILCAEAFIGKEPFAVLLGDDIVRADVPCTAQLISVFSQVGKPIVGIQPVAEHDIPRYGIVDVEWSPSLHERIGRILTMVEKPSIDAAPTNLAVMGRYVLTPNIFPILRRLEPGVRNEIQLTDGLKQLVAFDGCYAYAFNGLRLDVGNPRGFVLATLRLALEDDELRQDVIDLFNSLMKRPASATDDLDIARASG